MRYSIGHMLNDFGFKFFEKVHHPIFLVTQSGRVLKINEAGRKLLAVLGLDGLGEREFSALKELFIDDKKNFHRMSLGKHLHLVAQRFSDSDLVLVEVTR